MFQRVTGRRLGTSVLTFLLLCGSAFSADRTEAYTPHDAGRYGTISLPGGWTVTREGGEVRASSEDGKNFLRLYRVKKSAAKDVRALLMRRAHELDLPAFVRPVNSEQLDDANAKRGGFILGTVPTVTETPDNTGVGVPSMGSSAVGDTLDPADTPPDSVRPGVLIPTDTTGAALSPAEEPDTLEGVTDEDFPGEGVLAEDGEGLSGQPATYWMVVAYARKDGFYVMEGWSEDLPKGPMRLAWIHRSWTLKK